MKIATPKSTVEAPFSPKVNNLELNDSKIRITKDMKVFNISSIVNEVNEEIK